MAEHGGKAPPKTGGAEKKSGGGFWGFVSDVLNNVSVNVSVGKPTRPGVPGRSPTDPAQRMEPVRDERQEAYEETIYRKTEGADGTAPAVRVDRDRKTIARSLDARMGAQAETKMPQSGGSPLSRDVRTKMEPRLGSDLSDVRVHTGGESASAAEKLGARAFTTGSDVHFGAGQFAPGTKEGDRLIAHELTHVVQGQKSGVQRKADDGGGGDAAASAHAAEDEQKVSEPHEPAEKEADAVADKVTDDLHAGGDSANAGGKADSAHAHARGEPGAANHAGGKGGDKRGSEGAGAKGGEKKGADGGGAHGGAAPTAQKDHADAKASAAPLAATGSSSPAASPKEAAPAVGAKLIRAPLPINERVTDSSIGRKITRKIFRQEKKTPAPKPPAAPPKAAGAAAQQQPAAPKPQVLWDGVTVKPPMTGGNERVQVRPAAPGADGTVGLWVANQKGATRLLAINSVFATAKNQAGGRVVAAAIGKIADIEAAVNAVPVTKGKVDEDKIPMLQGKAQEAADAVSEVGTKLRTNSLEGAGHPRPMTNKVRVEFAKPDPNEWKTPYISKFIGEMVSQLQKQNTGLNELTVDEWVVNRERFSPSEHLNELDKNAKDAVLAKLKERCDEGLPRAEERLKRLKTKKTQLDGALQALQATTGATPDLIKEALKKAKEAASDVKSTEAEIQGYIDAGPEIAVGQAGQKMDPKKLQGGGGREDGQTAWANKHKKAKAAIIKLIEQNDPLVQDWVGIVKEVGDLAVLHDPDQIAGGRGDIDPLPVVKEPKDANDTDGHAAWREYLTKVKSHLGAKDINGSLGSQWKERIGGLYTDITTDPDCPQEAYPLRKVNAQFVPK